MTMKAILVIDIPDDFETKTATAIVYVKDGKGEGVTAMCTLKPMPKMLNAWDYQQGWNDCIKEIMGETE